MKKPRHTRDLAIDLALNGIEGRKEKSRMNKVGTIEKKDDWLIRLRKIIISLIKFNARER